MKKNCSSFLVQELRKTKREYICHHLQQTCPECSPPGERPVMYFLREAHIGWCPIFKAGSTKVVDSHIQIWRHMNVRHLIIDTTLLVCPGF